MEAPIPEEWINAVVIILNAEDRKRIEITQRALLDWSATFPNAFTYELYDAISDALTTQDVVGKLVANQPEQGVTYAFWFFHEKRKLYGKICLRPNKLIIKILSAHRPLQGENHL